ncbi:unnamed protein product [Prunus armeniaca]|uniref:Uncharacterized protein n=1 Tax=Prunus armeniaca TaxID=36596 RepID=A0A6J5X2R2_PRUAR|nr:unnamed protein product [Prunus armeniaca]
MTSRVNAHPLGPEYQAVRFAKTRRPLSKPVDQNFAAISIQGTSSCNALEDGVDEGSAFKHVSPNGKTEAEVRDTGTGNPLDDGSVKKLEDMQHEQMDNDLADSGDEMAHGALVTWLSIKSYSICDLRF